MASAAATVAMAIVVAAATVSSGLPAAHADANLISRTCKRTQDAALCVAVLTADPRSARASSAHGLADVALGIAAHAAGESLRDVSLLYWHSRDAPELGAASVCRPAYLAAAKELYFDARDSFNEGDYAGASQLVASAQRAGDRCEEAFKEVGMASPVADRNRQMTQRCVVARGLIDLLASSTCSVRARGRISDYL